MSERLVLVERFDELRPGMKVAVVRCMTCGGRHFGITLNRYVGKRGPSIEVVPDPHPEQGGKWCMNRASVRTRHDYRVLDGLESTDATTTTAPRKLETVR